MDITVDKNAPPAMEVVLNVELKCAWCLSEQGIPAGEGSHGICRKHADESLLQWRAHRVRRIKRG